MRVLLITDSLGCPREEIVVSDTWTDRILAKWSGKGIWFYTYCKHGLSAVDIDINYVKEIEPDLIIIQIGIVDACRRALSRKEIAFISHIRGVRTIIKKICNKYHYIFTSIRNIHYCKLQEFCAIIKRIKTETNAKIIFLSIAPAGAELIEKVYDIQGDINRYNDAIKSLPDIQMLNPYLNVKIEDYILNDGHHLNLLGNDMVYRLICDILSTVKGE